MTRFLRTKTQRESLGWLLYVLLLAAALFPVAGWWAPLVIIAVIGFMTAFGWFFRFFAKWVEAGADE